MGVLKPPLIVNLSTKQLKINNHFNLPQVNFLFKHLISFSYIIESSKTKTTDIKFILSQAKFHSVYLFASVNVTFS